MKFTGWETGGAALAERAHAFCEIGVGCAAQKRFALGIEPGSETPEASQKFFVEDVARWRRLIRDTGIKAE